MAKTIGAAPPEDRKNNGIIDANGESVELNIAGCGTAIIDISDSGGAWSGTMEVYLWGPVTSKKEYFIRRMGDATPTFLNQLTANGLFTVDCGGFEKITVTSVAWVSGAALVHVSGGQAQHAVFLHGPIPTGAATIGGVTFTNASATKIQDSNSDELDISAVGAARVIPHWGYADPPRRYLWSAPIAGHATIGQNLMAIENPTGSNPIWVHLIRCHMSHGGSAGVGVPLEILRCSGIGSGSLVTVADIPKINTAVANARLLIRTGTTVTTTSTGNERMLIQGGMEVVTASQGAWEHVWKAMDQGDRIRLAADQGLLWQIGSVGGNGNDRYNVTIGWEEEA